jgi:hypothetical protein
MTLTWFDAALEVLRDAGPMSPAQIIMEIERRQLRAITGQTPEATVAALLYTAVQNGDPRVRLVSAGLFGFGEAGIALSTASLGRLEGVDPRSIWPDEAQNFTPWLLSNADYLGEVLGLEIELEAREHPIGPYFLDLYGRDLTHQCVLIVENQLTATDHRHLGQLLTYAAGTQPPAGTIVWIAPEFRDEHREAMDFLNARVAQESGRQIRFFAVEMKVVRIGSSNPAPQFTVVAAPGEWSEQQIEVKAVATEGSKAQKYRAFWTRYLARIHEIAPQSTRVRTAPAAAWITMKHLRPGVQLNVAFIGGGKVSTEIYIDRGNRTKNLDIFFGLKDKQSSIEENLGEKLLWEDLPGKQACRVRLARKGDVNLIETHQELIEWFATQQISFARAFRPVVEGLSQEIWDREEAPDDINYGEES